MDTVVAKKALIWSAFVVILFLFIYKLDYPYFFTDEILRVNAGREYLNGIYEENMQVPFPTKYLAGFMYHLSNRDVFLMRLPFALMGFVTSLVLYKILRDEYGYKFGLVGVIIFSSSEIIFSASRMVMLEPLMHLSWVLFLYFYYKAINHSQLRWFLFSGLALGLSLASKVTSVILLPFTIVFFFYQLKSAGLKDLIFRYTLMYGTGLAVFFSTYIDTFRKIGEKETFNRVYETLQDDYLKKNEEGKPHVINGTVYLKSPAWTYLLYMYTKGGAIRLITYIAGTVFALANRNLFISFWGVFFLLSLSFHQFSTVKNVRYVSSFEIPMIVLSVSGLYYLSKKLPYIKYVLGVILVILFSVHAVNAVTQQKTEYNALYNKYLYDETNGFTSNDKIYVYGSIRSNHWYVHGKAVGMDMFDKEKFISEECYFYDIYTYIIFDQEELLRYGSNLIYEFVLVNIDSYEKLEKHGFLIYKRIPGSKTQETCVTTE
jgi:hypothetical protein